MSFIHYKFRSSLKADTLAFDGPAIRLGDLRDNIITQKKILKSPAYTLEITNAQTKEVYADDDVMVPKNSSVIVKRVPVQRLAAVTDQDGISKEEAELTELAFDTLSKTANLAGAKATEENKILAMMRQSTEDFDPSTYKKTPPATYVCHRCGKKGQHYVKTCPTIGDARFNTKIMTNTRTPSGIPKEYYVRKMQHENEIIERFRSMQDKNSRFSPVVGSDIVDQTKVPAELQCPICFQLFTDVVVTPCCGKSYCDECIRNYLIKNDIVCICGETTSPDNLIPNKALRISVDNFRNQKQSNTNPASASSSSLASMDNRSSPQPELTKYQQSPDLHSEHSQNGFSSPVPSALSEALAVNSPIKLESPIEMKLQPPVVMETNPKAIIVSQMTTVLPPQMIVASMHQPTLLTGSAAPHVLPGSQNFAAGPQNVIYSHGSHTSIRHPGYTNYLAHQPFIQQHQQPGIAGPPIQYGAINIAPGHTIVKRLVPVPVGPRIGLAQPNHIPLSFPQQTQNGAQLHGDVLHKEVTQVESLRMNENRSRKDRHGKTDVESPMPLTEDEFYLWQKQAKKRTSTRHRQTSPSEERQRHRSQSRSRSPSKRKRRRDLEESGEDSGLDRRKPRERSKKKSERRAARDSSQDSSKSDASKSRSTRSEKKASKSKSRHLPEHIKREVDEFEFDDELDFDEELKRLKNKGDEESTEAEAKGLVSADRSSLSVDKSAGNSRAATPISNADSAKNETSKESTNELDCTQYEVANMIETKDGEPRQVKEEVLNKDATAALSVTLNNGKPKKKTKIIKRKVTRIIKVRRKKSSLSTPEEPLKPIVVAKEGELDLAKEHHDINAKNIENTTSHDSKRKTDDAETKSLTPSKKVKANLELSNVSKKEASVEERKKLLHRKKTTIAAKTSVSNSTSPSKVQSTTAEVISKKEAEKKALLEKAKRVQRIKAANDQGESKSTNDDEEKRRKREKYILAKQKRAREREKLKNQEEVLSDDIHEDSKSEKLEVYGKKPDQQFYKPGEVKLKNLSEMTKKRLKQSEHDEKKSLNDDDESDVIKSKVTSIRKIISPHNKQRRNKLSASDNDDEYSRSYSGDEPTHRRVVKIESPKKRSILSSVGKMVGSSKNFERDSYETSRRRVKEVDSTSSIVREKRDGRHRQREDDDTRHESAKEKRRRQLDKEREERKRIAALEQEKLESIEREQQAIRDKERLERKYLKQQQRFAEMLRDKDKQKRKESSKKQLGKRKASTDDSEDSESEDTRSVTMSKTKKVKKPGYIIQIVDSENSESDDEEEELSGKERKHKRKVKHKKEKRKRKKKSSNESDEESVDSSEDSDVIQEDSDEPKKKKKKKHKSRKHKKRSKNKKHKKKSKKRKSRRKESSSEDEDEEDAGEAATEESEDEDDKSDEETDEKSEASQSVASDTKQQRHTSSSDETSSTTTEKSKPDNSNLKADKSMSMKLPSDEVNKEEISLDYTVAQENIVPIKSEVKTIKKRRETLDGEDIELDYNEDLEELDDNTLYGDLNLVDDEQTNPEVADEENPSQKSSADFEEGEILDENLYATTTTMSEKDTSVKTNKNSETCEHSNQGEFVKEKSLDNEKSFDELFDDNIDRAVDDAMNELSESQSREMTEEVSS